MQISFNCLHRCSQKCQVKCIQVADNSLQRNTQTNNNVNKPPHLYCLKGFNWRVTRLNPLETSITLKIFGITSKIFRPMWGHFVTGLTNHRTRYLLKQRADRQSLNQIVGKNYTDIIFAPIFPHDLIYKAEGTWARCHRIWGPWWGPLRVGEVAVQKKGNPIGGFNLGLSHSDFWRVHWWILWMVIWRVLWRASREGLYFYLNIYWTAIWNRFLFKCSWTWLTDTSMTFFFWNITKTWK